MSRNQMLPYMIFIIIHIFYVRCQYGFSDVTAHTFVSVENLTLLAFTDFDFDRKTDILALREIDGLQAEIGVVYGRDDNSPSSYQSLHSFKFEKNYEEISAAPVDFNGDLKTDLLITVLLSDRTINTLLCLNSEGTQFNCARIYAHNNIQISTKCLPMVFDYNGDMLPDLLFIEDKAATVTNLTLLLASANGTFKDVPLPACFQKSLRTEDSIAYDHSSFLSSGPTFDSGPFVNLVTKKAILTAPVYESVEPRKFLWPETDEMTHVTPIANHGFVYGYNKPNGSGVVIARVRRNYQQGRKWITSEYVQTVELTGYALTSSSSHRWIRAADLNNDGVVDYVAILNNTITKSPEAVVFLLGEAKPESSRIPHTLQTLSIEGDIEQLAVYDIYNDGRLDILYVSDHGGTSQLHALKNTLSPDSNFIELQVASGLCPSEPCEKPYTNIVGAHVNMTTTAVDGKVYYVDMIQLPQATGFSLHLPYLHVGLDKDSNYVDSINIGLHKYECPDASKPVSRSWQALLPNSHLMIIPHPPNEPNKWSLHLYVVPSKLVLSTGLVLLGVCGVLAIIIGILHLKEKRDDREENMKDQQFHFNTM